MKYSYHTHTRYCRHAVGEPEDYVKQALQCGFLLYCLCDHSPEDNKQYRRMRWNELPEYLEHLSRVEKQYGSQIQLPRAFEAEYFPDFMDVYRQLKKDENIPYWILGQHQSSDHITNNFSFKDPTEDTERYTEDVIAGMRTGFFQILAHPDLIMVNFEKPNEQILSCMDRIFACCCETGTVAEINANGMRYHKNYPSREIWTLAKKYPDLKIIISSDAHDPLFIQDEYVRQAEQFAKDLNLNVIEHL